MSSGKITKIVKSGDPDNVGARIHDERVRLGMSQGELARAIGLKSANAIKNYEKGQMPRYAILRALAQAFGRPVDWLLEPDAAKEDGAPYGFAIPTGLPADIPVVGSVRGGRGQFSEDGYPVGEGYRRVRRPFDVTDKNAFAVIVDGESMAPRYEKGDMVVCSPAKEWRAGDYCVVITRGGEQLIKRVHERDGHFVLTSLAPGYEPLLFERKDIRAIHKIVWKKER